MKKHIIKILLLFSFFLLSLNSFSQDKTHPEDSLYSTRYNKARNLYIQSLYSKSSMHAKKLGDAYRKKLNFFGDSSVLAKKESHLKWVKENLSTTGFQSYEEAVKAFEEIEHAAAAEVAENKELYDYILYCAREYRDYRLLPDIVADVESSNPELFILYKKYE